MERLTEKTTDGILVKENYSENGLRTFYQCFGEKPNDNYSNCEERYCAMEKLAAYEDAEEQGLLLRLPCKVGDTVYKPNPITKKGIVEIKIESIFITESEINISGSTTIKKYLFCCQPGDFGKTVFLTEAEAEAKLAEMEGAE